MLKSLFLWLSQSSLVRAAAERSTVGRRLSSRFVAGQSREEALGAAAVMNRQGMSVSIDYLGENVGTSEQARLSAEVYGKLLEEIHARGLKANVSLKLTHMGLDISEDLARELVSALVRRAAALDNFVRVDMEGSAYTERTLEVVRRLHAEENFQDRLGAVIQAYLYRSERDVEDLLRQRIRIRLCKGAYDEPPEVAFREKRDVDHNFVQLMKALLKSGIYHGIATHDQKMIEATLAFAAAERIPPEAFEFQMLYGIRRDLQRSLVKQGWRVRVYIPFGSEWYPYLMRRLAERPANVFFLARHLFR